MHEQILLKIESIKSNEHLSPQDKIDSLFDIKNEEEGIPYLKG